MNQELNCKLQWEQEHPESRLTYFEWLDKQRRTAIECQDTRGRKYEHKAEEDRHRTFVHEFQVGEEVSHPYYGMGIVMVAQPWHPTERCGQIITVKFADGSEREVRADAAGLGSVSLNNSCADETPANLQSSQVQPNIFKVGENVTHPHYGKGVVQVAHPWRSREKYGQLVKVRFGDGSERELRVDLAGLKGYTPE